MHTTLSTNQRKLQEKVSQKPSSIKVFKFKYENVNPKILLHDYVFCW